MSDDSGNAAISITLKAGQGYDSPWVVIRADDPQAALNRLNAVGQLGILARTAEVATELQGVYAAARPVQNGGIGATAVAVEGTQAQAGWSSGGGQQAAQSGGTPSPRCQHGERVFREGVSKKTGKPYKAWYCPNPNRDAQCAPEWAS